MGHQIYYETKDVALALAGQGSSMKTPQAVRAALVEGRMYASGRTPRGSAIFTEEDLARILHYDSFIQKRGKYRFWVRDPEQMPMLEGVN
jgi:hypothetical protein